MPFTVIPAAPVITSFSPSSGVTGDAIAISGNNLAGATSARFNGVSAQFTVQSATQISAIVPNGCSSGAIAITTPGGTATSNTGFTVNSTASIQLSWQDEGSTITTQASSINFVGAGVIASSSSGAVTITIPGGTSGGGTGGGTSNSSESDAVIAAIEATGITLSSSQKDACRNRINSMISSGIWSKRIAYYGFLGGTAGSHAINWKSPGNYNISWNGTLIHGLTGVQGNGSTGYGNTQIPLNIFNAQNTHFSLYNRKAIACSFGTFTTSTNNAFYSQDLFFRSAQGSGAGGTDSDARSSSSLISGYILGVASPTPIIDLYKNGQNITTSRPSGLPGNYVFTRNSPITFLAINGNSNFSNTEIASFALGYSLTPSEILADYNSELVYQTALNRNV